MTSARRSERPAIARLDGVIATSVATTTEIVVADADDTEVADADDTPVADVDEITLTEQFTRVGEQAATARRSTGRASARQN